MKILLPVLLAALVAGCATPPPPPRPVPLPKPKPVPLPTSSPVEIDRSLSAKGQSSRVKFVILHYTVTDTPTSIKILTQQSVSSHYLVTDENPPRIFGLVDETRQSNHAGVSYWKNYTLLNGNSIGIEIVNPGFTEGPDGRVYYPFPQAQVDRLIVLLKDIVKRHQIPPENILGHVDIAPTRKQDPGPLFPWRQLADHGLVVWPDAARVAAARAVYETQLPDTTWLQRRLIAYGFVLPVTAEMDATTRAALVAFQMKYRPRLFDGTLDAETASLLEALVPTPVQAPRVITSPVTPLPPASSTPLRVTPLVPPGATPAPAVPAPAPIQPVVPAPAPVQPPVQAPARPPVQAPAPAPAQGTTPAITPASPPLPAVIPTPAPATPPVQAPVPTQAPAPATPTPTLQSPAPAPVTPAPVTPAPATDPVQEPAAPPAAPAPAAPVVR